MRDDVALPVWVSHSGRRWCRPGHGARPARSPLRRPSVPRDSLIPRPFSIPAKLPIETTLLSGSGVELEWTIGEEEDSLRGTVGRETVPILRSTEGIRVHEEPTGNGRHLRLETGAPGETSAPMSSAVDPEPRPDRGHTRRPTGRELAPRGSSVGRVSSAGGRGPPRTGPPRTPP